MENALIVIVLFCAILAYCMFKYFQSPSRPNVPPGPFEWPLIGSRPSMLISSIYHREPSHVLLTRLAQHYGKIFSIGLGGFGRIIVLNNYEVIKEAFQKPELSDRKPLPDCIREAKGGIGVLSASGDIWKHQRRISLSAFRRFGVGKTTYDEQIAIEATHLSKEISGLLGKPFNPRQLLMNATANMICVIAFGSRFEYQDKEFQQLIFNQEERAKAMGFGTFSKLPLPKWLRVNRINALLKILRQNVAYFRNIITDHKKNLDEGADCNVTDMYLKELERSSTEGGQGAAASTTLTEGNLVNLLDNLFLAGQETSANTLAWCLLHVIEDLDVQRRIRNEVMAFCGRTGGRMPMYSDRSELPFTQAVIQEVQRLHTIVPLGGPHYAAQETSLEGYTIPQGSIVIANLWAIHHDPDIWGDPDVFRPSRFLDQEGRVYEDRVDCIPFALGRRVCLGEMLAKTEIFIFLTHLLYRFSFKKPTASTTLSFEGSSNGLTYAPLPYQLRAENAHDVTLGQG